MMQADDGGVTLAVVEACGAAGLLVLPYADRVALLEDQISRLLRAQLAEPDKPEHERLEALHLMAEDLAARVNQVAQRVLDRRDELEISDEEGR